MNNIAISVSEICNVPLSLMRGNTTGLPETNARFIAMSVALALEPMWELHDVGDYFCRHRSVVRVARAHVSQAVLTNTPPSLARLVRRVSVDVGLLPTALIVSR